MVLGNIGKIAARESSDNIFVTSSDLPAPGGVAVNRVGLTRCDWNFSISPSYLMTSENSGSSFCMCWAWTFLACLALEIIRTGSASCFGVALAQ